MKITNTTEKRWNNTIIALIVLGLLCLSLFYVIPFIIISKGIIPLDDLQSYFFNTTNLKEEPKSNADIIGTLGTIGDWFGGTTVPILTFLSFLGVMIAIMIQRQELGLQIKELQETREEFVIQRFENTFFSLVSLHNDITKNIYIKPGIISTKNESIKSGRDAFVDLYSELEASFKTLLPPGPTPNEQIRSQNYSGIPLMYQIHFSYKNFISEYEGSIGHYFSNIYRIIKLIDENQNLSFEEKQNYIGIFQAQLSTYELLLIFYNSLSHLGSEKFLPLIKKYNILDNMNSSLLINRKHGEVFDDYELIKIKELKNKMIEKYSKSKSKECRDLYLSLIDSGFKNYSDVQKQYNGFRAARENKSYIYYFGKELDEIVIFLKNYIELSNPNKKYKIKSFSSPFKSLFDD